MKRLRVVRRVENEVRQLEAIEQSGESAETVPIAIGEVALVLVPTFLLMLAIALIVFYYT